jgi:hypothetical protein
MQIANKDFWPLYGKVVLFSFATFVLIIAVACDSIPLFQNSDYISCLYVGAKLFAQGRFDDMYAPYGATGFCGTPCDLAAHKFLPFLDATHNSLYNYSPLVAWLLAPLSLLPPGFSLMAWQAVSFAALGTSIVLLLRSWRERLIALGLSLVFMPIAVTLWIGQLDLVFGVFFYSLGFRLLTEGKSLPAGISFAAACLKPQMIVVPALVSLVLLLRRKFAFAFGCAIGLAALVGANVAVGGPELFRRWLWNVRLCEKVFTDPQSGLAHHLIISLPGTFLLSVFKQPLPWIKPATYLFAFLVAISVVFICYRFSKRHDGNTYLTAGYSVTLSLLAMPLLIPNYLYYDFSLFFLIGCLCADDRFRRESGMSTRLLIITMIVLNSYGILFMAIKGFSMPLLPLLWIVFLFVRSARGAAHESG